MLGFHLMNWSEGCLGQLPVKKSCRVLPLEENTSLHGYLGVTESKKLSLFRWKSRLLQEQTRTCSHWPRTARLRQPAPCLGHQWVRAQGSATW